MLVIEFFSALLSCCRVSVSSLDDACATCNRLPGVNGTLLVTGRLVWVPLASTRRSSNWKFWLTCLRVSTSASAVSPSGMRISADCTKVRTCAGEMPARSNVVMAVAAGTLVMSPVIEMST
ncbi:Flagellar motor protein MotB [Pseudomonas syringae pv. actinidiae]|uniref:Flagellar motor protein MotB n=1 Tax=Pseudomonas syringae pv. actinidiae TaxID=103796 RepID=A0A2V0Q8C2_PSESF|nr:Flagellar motor protein MotB [Pseudomonas syringae pv. actinidiae]